MRRSLFIGTTLFWLFICAGLAPPLTAAPPQYDIINIGLTDAEHTSSDGTKVSNANQLNEAGQVSGYALRYNGGSADLGQSAWLYNGSTTLNIGLTGVEHTSSDGYKFSDPGQLNEAGQVSGYAERYNGGSTFLGTSAWLYNGSTTLNIGLTDAEHTSSDGYKHSGSQQLNEAGQVAGFALRYNGGSADLGQSEWLYNGSTTLNIGLTGVEHTRSDGYKYSEFQQLNEAGQVTGSADRYNGGSTSLGTSAWLYNGSTTLNIGLTGVEHTSSDGTKYSAPQQLNEAGQVAGFAARYNGGSANLGASAWLYNGSTTLNIGLTGAEHTRSDGFKSSPIIQLNEAGQVIGYAERYNGGIASLGTSAWLYNGSTTLNIGLTSAEYTRSDGYKHSESQKLNEAGQVAGYAERYNGGSAYLGNSAWLYNGSTTINIGLTGAEHTRSDGYKHSGSQQLNQAGQVIGNADRYNGGSANLGQSAWLYNSSTTLNIGLTGVEHTRSDGTKYSNPWQLNEAGQVIGSAERYNGGSADLGQSAWLYNGSTTLNIGLTGVEHTRDDGYKFSVSQQLNEAGQVIGYAERYNGGSDSKGYDAWVYDPILGTVELQLSVSDDGTADSSAEYLGADGVVLGSYEQYSGVDDLGPRAFYWTRAAGLWDLGSLVDGGLSANGWEALYNTVETNGLGDIDGYGLATGVNPAGQSAFLLVPVPEPNSIVLATIGLVSLSVCRWRREPR